MYIMLYIYMYFNHESHSLAFNGTDDVLRVCVLGLLKHSAYLSPQSQGISLMPMDASNNEFAAAV